MYIYICVITVCVCECAVSRLGVALLDYLVASSSASKFELQKIVLFSVSQSISDAVRDEWYDL